MKTEHSAGGLVIYGKRRILRILLIKDMNNKWTFPKGIIETDEQPDHAAFREVQEETGIRNLQNAGYCGTVRYTYKKNSLIQKTVDYYLFRTEDDKNLKPQKNEGIHEAKFFPMNEAKRIIGYRDTNIPLLKKALSTLSPS